MKLLIYADPHFSSYSSIIRSQGKKYTTRLDNEIKSINWLEKLAVEKNCSSIICLGDFFDKSFLDATEISALRDIVWSDIPHVYLTGNHEITASNLELSSNNLFSLCPKSTIVDSIISFLDDNVKYIFIPYISKNENLPSLNEYFDTSRKNIIFSHNNIAGVQLGKFKTEDGFDISEIENNCDLFINGHLHNHSKIGKKIINLGNLTGQNFSEDAQKYTHYIMILDTDDLSIEYIENPFAFNFYKLKYEDCKNIKLKNNAVISLQCTQSNINEAKEYLTNDNIISSRITIEAEPIKSENINISNEIISTDHIAKFKEYIKEKITSKYLLDELREICQ